ncbi:uncharacterized protein LOC111284552 [Durio zibethinus]|uniref:Uncharacterized protein LOC111284552 n=1 Tax=Durio zibethinus TaxID=66656 RepID=A0A6P5XM63_DURZI|nr:uncharacterized protein LOC111284552 [Durio zibethinus]
MDLSLEDSATTAKPNFLIGENYQLCLIQSLEDLLAETHKETPKFSDFIDKFYYLMHAKIDPPLESIWVYSALSFRSHNFGSKDPLNGLSIIKDLFQLVSSCSSPSNSFKSIALVAPIVFEVYKLVVEVLGKDLGSKREKTVNKKVKCLVEVIIGYISMCCCKDLSKESEGIDVNLVIPVEDLVSIWMDRNVNLQSFFPLVGDEIYRMNSKRGFDVNYLAGVVMVEAFLLKLCLDLRLGTEGMVLEKELRSWAVASISSFHNFYFFEILLRMLLQPALPVTALLGPEDGVLLRNILYDAVILVEYSFLKSETVHLSAERVKSICMTRLIVTLEAIELFRKNGDQNRATHYTSAFANSCLPSQITKWISCLIGMDEKARGISGSSPKALIKCLLNLEKQGIKVFDDGMKYHAKLHVDDSKAVSEQSASKVEQKKLEDDPLFYLDAKGEAEDEDEENEMKNESMTAAFVAAAHSMRLVDSSRGKRKGSGSEGKEKIKYFKYDLSSNSNSAKEKVSGWASGSASASAATDDDLSSESEVENPVM